MATIADVARHAGVAPSTVSYALSGKRPISESARRRIDDSIRTLGYRPHAGARALASSKSNVVALMLPLRDDMHVPTLLQFATGVVTAARGHDHDVLLLTHDEGGDGISRVATGSMADALVVMDVEREDARIPVLRTLDRPCVLIGVAGDAGELTSVDLDFVAAGELAVDHLAELGHRHVGLVGQPPSVYSRRTGFADRFIEGFTAASQRHGARVAVRPCEFTYAGVATAVEALLAELPELTALVVHNEHAAPMLLETLSSMGRKVPDDISIVSMCTDDVAERMRVPLTSIAIPAAEIGSRAVDMVMNKLHGREAPGLTLLPPRLARRDSTAAPTGR
ncbi:LacI family transcriptional regulator [Haloactinopolyspora alba]|uniref:LacI family transcriptional regulator n=1 Tax=Haloactinopolyspora alba TaxID=648780 RepID=A0A2P8E6Z0_9ACTN|nr:LacI family DNA-binding transcriptional regulator [Haloactinopolyspora alba]PSL05240.1 LacI family transcriptional regulator [Haloactinopolyspora alba]